MVFSLFLFIQHWTFWLLRGSFLDVAKDAFDRTDTETIDSQPFESSRYGKTSKTLINQSYCVTFFITLSITIID